MIRVNGRAFACDECPICNGIEHRLQTAAVIGGEPQFEYCWCDKVQDEFYIGGYCSDAFSGNILSHRKHGARKTGSAYRRRMRQQKKEKRMQIMIYGHNPPAGYTDWEMVDGVFQPTGDYIKYPRDSDRQVYWKNQSNRKVRRYQGYISKGNSYRKYFEYKYTIF